MTATFDDSCRRGSIKIEIVFISFILIFFFICHLLSLYYDWPNHGNDGELTRIYFAVCYFIKRNLFYSKMERGQNEESIIAS